MKSTKHEWRKSEKQYYLPKAKPEFIDIPPFNFLSIDGTGRPDAPEFAERISALYSISYPIKMNLKRMESQPKGYIDYTVYPLEGVWDITDEAKAKGIKAFDKSDLVYTLMIRQPDFVTLEYVEEMIAVTRKKKDNAFWDDLNFGTLEEGPCIQMLHIGSFDDEPKTFKIMENWAQENGHTRTSRKHREIYLSDFNKVPAEKLKTVLRFQVG